MRRGSRRYASSAGRHGSRVYACIACMCLFVCVCVFAHGRPACQYWTLPYCVCDCDTVGLGYAKSSAKDLELRFAVRHYQSADMFSAVIVYTYPQRTPPHSAGTVRALCPHSARLYFTTFFESLP